MGTNQPDPQLLAAMQAFQQQGGQGGGMPPGMSAPGGMPMPKMPEMIDDVGTPMPRMPGIIGMPGGAGGKGAGLPPGLNRPMPMPPGNMVSPPPFKIMPKPTPRPQPVRPKEFGGFR
jgi:hypothetical protein